MKFIVTEELGRLARWLRILGFDTAYFHKGKSSSLIIQALREERIVITRNHKLPESRGLKIFLIKSEIIKGQLKEVFGALKINPDKEKMFTRCLICNKELLEIAKEQIRDQVPDYVFKTQDNFVACPQCKRVYWQGTHWGNVAVTLKEIMDSLLQ